MRKMTKNTKQAVEHPRDRIRTPVFNAGYLISMVTMTHHDGSLMNACIFAPCFWTSQVKLVEMPNLVLLRLHHWAVLLYFPMVAAFAWLQLRYHLQLTPKVGYRSCQNGTPTQIEKVCIEGTNLIEL